ncbi:HD domain-containing protein [Clostridium sp. JN-9]|uniref:3'-5' exoribonuclease YhaM family protein n=1 Tax=Clostridium sp. JN-9 TaxID=2507159 RepID=UPI000FFE14CD|nr:HD domain-containing protein [Clostridium sp. JN-9]QAT39449.1 HD domain-containing protein [Clostridium sp. JN-9]
MEYKTISQLEAGTKIDGFYIIKSVEVKTSSTNKKYLDFTLGDKTGEINAKLWDCSDEDLDTYKANTLVKVRAVVADWQSRLQLKLERIRLSVPEDNVNIEDFVPVAPYSSEDMYSTLLGYINNMKDEDIKNIVMYIIEEKEEKLKHYPAAMKNHHSIRGGLLYHVTTMLKVGEKICEVYTSLNKDLLFGGIILHDIAKIEEMDASELGIVNGYTVEGQLLGHIIQGIKQVEIAADALGVDKEKSMLLQHLILTHHYEPEYGSPKKPMIPEGEILHHLDEMDAVMFDMNKALKSTEKGCFSDKVWTLQRKVYKPED